MKPIKYRYQAYKQVIAAIVLLLAFPLIPGMVQEISAGDLISIRIVSKVQIDDENILLGSIADIEGQDSLLVKKLKGIVISKAPLPGESRVLENSAFKMRLKRNGINVLISNFDRLIHF